MRQKTFHRAQTVFLFTVILLIFSLKWEANAHAEPAAFSDKLFGKPFEFVESSEEIVVKFPRISPSRREEAAQAEGLSLRYSLTKEGIAVYKVPPDRPMEAVREGLRQRVGADSLPAMTDQEGYLRYMVPGELAVQFNDGLSEAGMQAVIERSGSHVIHKQYTPGFYRVSIPEGMTLFEAVEAYQRLDDIKFAEPVHFEVNSADVIPNDPNFNLSGTNTTRGRQEGPQMPTWISRRPGTYSKATPTL